MKEPEQTERNDGPDHPDDAGVLRRLVSRHPIAITIRIGIVILVAALIYPGLQESSVRSAPVDEEWPGTDFSRHSVDLEEIVSGGPPRDGIPSIDEPRFEDVRRAARWLDPREPVVLVVIDDIARAYPLQVLIWHEIVNDEIVGRSIAVTFCPLCNASLVFSRELDGEVLSFGTTGRLRRDDMVMYDRQTESWWQQLTGEAIVGRLTGARLDEIPSRIVAFETFAERYPGSDVLSRRTGHLRAYGTNPYQGYDNIDRPAVLEDGSDARLRGMDRVLAVTVGRSTRVFPLTLFRELSFIEESICGSPIVIIGGPGTLSVLDRGQIADSRTVATAAAYAAILDGRILSFRDSPEGPRDHLTGSLWHITGTATEGPLAGSQLEPLPGGVHFAFAWLAFRPDAVIYGAGTEPVADTCS